MTICVCIIHIIHTSYIKIHQVICTSLPSGIARPSDFVSDLAEDSVEELARAGSILCSAIKAHPRKKLADQNLKLK